jgi:hypothetical protein
MQNAESAAQGLAAAQHSNQPATARQPLQSVTSPPCSKVKTSVWQTNDPDSESIQIHEFIIMAKVVDVTAIFPSPLMARPLLLPGFRSSSVHARVLTGHTAATMAHQTGSCCALIMQWYWQSPTDAPWQA